MKFLNGKHWDIFLIIFAVIVLTVFIIGRFNKRPFVPEKTGINISSRFMEIFGEETAALITCEFEEQNPHMKINWIEKNDETEADIVFFDDNEFGNLKKEAALSSLDPYMYSGDHSEVQLALPLVSFMDLFYYNIDILSGAGRIRPPKTRAETLDTARAVNRQKNAFPLALGFGEVNSEPRYYEQMRSDIFPWIWADGQEILNGNSLSLNSLNTITFFGQLYRDDLLAPGIFEKTGEQRIEEFAEGKIAMMAASSRYIQYLQKKEINFNITAIPANSTGKNRLGTTKIYAGISAQCLQPDNAWIFLNLIAGKNQILAQTLKAVPGSYPVSIPCDYIYEDEMLSKAWEIFEAAEIIEYNSANPDAEEISGLVWEKISEKLR